MYIIFLRKSLKKFKTEHSDQKEKGKERKKLISLPITSITSSFTKSPNPLSQFKKKISKEIRSINGHFPTSLPMDSPRRLQLRR